MAVFGPIILDILRGSKSFGNHISENHLDNSFAALSLVGHGIKWARKANIWPKMTNNPNFGPNLAFLAPKILILGGESNTFSTLISENQ